LFFNLLLPPLQKNPQICCLHKDSHTKCSLSKQTLGEFSKTKADEYFCPIAAASWGSGFFKQNKTTASIAVNVRPGHGKV